MSQPNHSNFWLLFLIGGGHGGGGHGGGGRGYLVVVVVDSVS